MYFFNQKHFYFHQFLSYLATFLLKQKLQCSLLENWGFIKNFCLKLQIHVTHARMEIYIYSSNEQPLTFNLTQIRFIFQHSPPGSPHTSSINVAVLPYHFQKRDQQQI